MTVTIPAPKRTHPMNEIVDQEIPQQAHTEN